MILTDEQETVFDNVVNNVRAKQKLITLGGYAGTGKTVLAKAIHEKFPSFLPCAPTGKAAMVMRSKGIRHAATIHSTIYFVDDKGPEVKFILKEPHKLESGAAGFLIDEASMVSESLFEDLTSFKLPIIFIGDHGQLEPVGSDINLMSRPDFKLETIHRNAGEIAYFAEHLRKGGNYYQFKTNGQVKITNLWDCELDDILACDQIICGFNKTRVAINQTIRNHYGYHGTLNNGEKVICLKNNRERGLFNGLQGIAKNVNHKDHTFDFYSCDDGVIVPGIKFYPYQFGQETTEKGVPSDLDLFDYGYCITCHKSQGSEWGTVAVVHQKCQGWKDFRWAYTAASRAKTKLIWIASKKYGRV